MPHVVSDEIVPLIGVNVPGDTSPGNEALAVIASIMMLAVSINNFLILFPLFSLTNKWWFFKWK